MYITESFFRTRLVFSYNDIGVWAKTEFFSLYLVHRKSHVSEMAQTLHIFLLSHECSKNRPLFLFLNLRLQNIWWKYLQVINFSSCHFLHPLVTPPLYFQILFLSLCFQTLWVSSFLFVRDKFSPTYNKIGNVILLYTLILDSRWEDKQFWTEW